LNASFIKGFRHGLAIGIGYLSVSFAFGMKAVADGLTPLEAVLISMTNLTSAGQVAGVPLIIAQASLLEAALTQLIINLRYALMSISLSQKMAEDMNTPRRMIFAFANTDEVFAMAASQPEKLNHDYLFGLMVLPFLGWTIGTLLGAVAGQLLPEFVRTALTFAIYGMFMAIIIPPARKEKSVCMVVLIAIALSCCFRYIPALSGMSSGFVIIICAVVASAIGAWLFPVKEEKES
jgi:4-azaleucine resistance transporter AzlC